MAKPLQGILADIATLNTEVKTIFDTAGDEPLSAEQMTTVTENNRKIEDLEHQAKDLITQRDLKAAAARRDLEQNATPKTNTGAQQSTVQTLAERIVHDEIFQEWLQKMQKIGAATSKNTRIDSPQIPINTKTLLTGTSSTSAGALVTNERLNIIDPGTSYRPITILDLITRGTTGSDSVEYVREGAHTNNAAPVAEATATGDGTGAKPESAMLLAIVTEVVKTIAHWIPASRRALADAGQLMTLIQNFLRYGLIEELEDQVVNGSGVGENFTGILTTANLSTQAYDTGILKTTRKARTKVRTLGRATPTAYAMHPTDWEAFDLLVDAETRYYFGGPSVIGTPRLWGLPVVETEALAAGRALVADWRLAVLWDREQANTLMTDSHSDFFVRNLIAILTELRAAFTVLRPAAFVDIDLTP